MGIRRAGRVDLSEEARKNPLLQIILAELKNLGHELRRPAPAFTQERPSFEQIRILVQAELAQAEEIVIDVENRLRGLHQGEDVDGFWMIERIISAKRLLDSARSIAARNAVPMLATHGDIGQSRDQLTDRLRYVESEYRSLVEKRYRAPE